MTTLDGYATREWVCFLDTLILDSKAQVVLAQVLLLVGNLGYRVRISIAFMWMWQAKRVEHWPWDASSSRTEQKERNQKSTSMDWVDWRSLYTKGVASSELISTQDSKLQKPQPASTGMKMMDRWWTRRLGFPYCPWQRNVVDGSKDVNRLRRCRWHGEGNKKLGSIRMMNRSQAVGVSRINLMYI